MNTLAHSETRLAAITLLAQQMAAHGGVGHTGVMKLIYLLQETKGFPVGYDFQLYTYGPYDARVLEDLKIVQIKRAVASREVEYEFGRGYQISPGPAAGEIIAKGALSPELEQAIDSIVEDFGHRSAADLEMIGTIIFADRTLAQDNEKTTTEALADRVHGIKPYIKLPRILNEIRQLQSKDLLTSLA